MHGKVRVIKGSCVKSLKKEEVPKVSSKENFKNWVADWQTGPKENGLPTLKNLFPSQGGYGNLNTTS